VTVAPSIPTLADLFAAQLRAYSDGLRVMLPAEVVEWSAADPGRASVRPTVRLVRRVDGALVSYRPPILASAPVAYPTSGSYGLTFPLAVGSTGALVFADRSIDEWVVNANADSEPRDLRRHAYADGVFVPGLRAYDLPARVQPTSGALVVACPVAGEVRLGSSNATSLVALAPLVEAQLSALVTAITAAPTVPGDGGAAFKAALLAALSAWPAPVGSARVRSE
jgi:hypothetical protein